MAPVLPRIRDAVLDILHHSSSPLQPSPRSSSSSSSSPMLSLRFASAPPPPPASLTPTRTLTTGLTRVFLPRQAAHTTSTVPAGYGSGPGTDVGKVVGITLGSVAGFLLLLWLVYSSLNRNNQDAFTDAESTVMSVGTASVGTRRVRKVHRHHRSPRRETVEIRTGSGRPVIVEERGGSRVREVVVEDTTTRRRSASRARPPPPRVVVDDDEEIVVLEEHTPPRRHKSRRRSSAERRSGGYRVVAEDEVIREVRRESGSRRR